MVFVIILCSLWQVSKIKYLSVDWPSSSLVQIGWFTHLKECWSERQSVAGVQCSFPFFPHFSCVSLMSFPQGSLPSPPQSWWVTLLLFSAYASLSQCLLQLLLNVYLGDCFFNACLFHLTICFVGVEGPCVVCCPISRACHSVWNIVGANLLNGLIKK